MQATRLTEKQREVFLGTLQELAKGPRHAPTVQVFARSVVGGVRYFPLNPAARAFAKLTGREWLTAEALATIRDELSYAVEINERRV